MSSPPKALHGSLQYQPNLNYDAPDTDQMLRGEHVSLKNQKIR